MISDYDSSSYYEDDEEGDAEETGERHRDVSVECILDVASGGRSTQDGGDAAGMARALSRGPVDRFTDLCAATFSDRRVTPSYESS